MREDGYYWVRVEEHPTVSYDADWKVAQYVWESGLWYLAAPEEVGWSDEELAEIDERRIVRAA